MKIINTDSRKINPNLVDIKTRSVLSSKSEDIKGVKLLFIIWSFLKYFKNNFI